jgi:hypothetical protein
VVVELEMRTTRGESEMDLDKKERRPAMGRYVARGIE